MLGFLEINLTFRGKRFSCNWRKKFKGEWQELRKASKIQMTRPD